MKTQSPAIRHDDRARPGALPLRLRLLRFVGRQTWIPRGHNRLVNLIWSQSSENEFPFEVDFFGMRYPGNLAESIDYHVFVFGAFARRELTLLEALTAELRKTKDRITFFDFGANIGHHTLFMSQRADEVISFEPFPVLQEKLRQKVALNQRTNIRLIPFALGDEDTVLRYFPGGGGNSGAGTFIPESFETYDQPIEIPIRRGDSLFSELGLPRIDIVKIDVEGFESRVFRGLAERLRRDRPPILMEMGDRCRSGFGSEDVYRSAFYEGAAFAEVAGRYGCEFKLRPFRYASSREAIAVPPELAPWLKSRIETR